MVLKNPCEPPPIEHWDDPKSHQGCSSKSETHEMKCSPNFVGAFSWVPFRVSLSVNAERSQEHGVDERKIHVAR